MRAGAKADGAELENRASCQRPASHGKMKAAIESENHLANSMSAK